jgi:hypothetical protein
MLIPGKAMEKEDGAIDQQVLTTPTPAQPEIAGPAYVTPLPQPSCGLRMSHHTSVWNLGVGELRIES